MKPQLGILGAGASGLSLALLSDLPSGRSRERDVDQGMDV